MRATVLVVVEGSLCMIGYWTLIGMKIGSSFTAGLLFLSGITIGSFLALSVFPKVFLAGCF